MPGAVSGFVRSNTALNVREKDRITESGSKGGMIMTAKEYLYQAYRLDELIKSYQRELASLKELSLSIGSQDTSKDAVSVSKDNSASFTRIVDKIADLEAKINNEIEHYISVKNEIHSVIEAVEDNDEKLCLRYRYVEFMTWEQIADKMHYSVMQVTRIHGHALQLIKIP